MDNTTLKRSKLDQAYIIAEIGINHNGDVDIAKELIRIAAVCKFDAVKFQKRNPDVCVPAAQKNKKRETPWGTMTYLEYKKKVEFGRREYNAIDKLCKELGIHWSASPWDIDSVDFLSKYRLPWVKIPSASINNKELLEYVGSKYKYVILSTGASDMPLVKAAYSTLEKSGVKTIDVLHCNSTYPAPIDQLNLKCINTMRATFPESNIGYSGHEYGLQPTISTIALGSKIIERHVTLDKNMWGTDQGCSLEPHAMFKLVRSIRELEKALGSSEKLITQDEHDKMKSLR